MRGLTRQTLQTRSYASATSALLVSLHRQLEASTLTYLLLPRLCLLFDLSAITPIKSPSGTYLLPIFLANEHHKHHHVIHSASHDLSQSPASTVCVHSSLRPQTVLAAAQCRRHNPEQPSSYPLAYKARTASSINQFSHCLSHQFAHLPAAHVYAH